MQNVDPNQLAAVIAAALQQFNNAAAVQAAPAPQMPLLGRRSGIMPSQTRGAQRLQVVSPGQTRSGGANSSQNLAGEPIVSEANRVHLATPFREENMSPALPMAPIVHYVPPNTAGKAARERRLLAAAALPEIFGRTISPQQVIWIRDNAKPVYSKICAHAQLIKVNEWRANQSVAGGLNEASRQERVVLRAEARRLQVRLQAESEAYRSRTKSIRLRLQEVQARLAELGVSSDASANDLAGPAYMVAAGSYVPSLPTSSSQAVGESADAFGIISQATTSLPEDEEDGANLSD